MTENNVPNHPNNMDVTVFIDKEKLPEDVRKLLEENLPKDAPEQLKLSIEMLQKGKMDNIAQLQKDKPPDNKSDNKLFAIQTGTVVGNIYADDTYKKEEDSYIKKKDI